MKEENIKKAQEAGRKAVEGRRKGFHCSESVFTAINDVLKITDPSLVRMVTGFHGGGGIHRKVPGITLLRFWRRCPLERTNALARNCLLQT